MIKPGGQCPWSLLDGNWFFAQKVVSPAGEDTQRERRDQEKKKLAAIDKLSVEIDGVLFSDGSFVGPDSELKFDWFEASNRGALDMIAELNRKLDEGEDIFAYADGFASITRRQIEALYPDARAILPNLERAYAISKKGTAMNVINRRQKIGEPATIERIRESAKSRIPLVRR